MSKITSTEYHAIIISDHAPLSMDIQFKASPLFSSPWRFNPILLDDNTFVEFISVSINHIIATNQPSCSSHSLLRETLNAYLRGQIISFLANANKIRKIKIEELTSNILNIDRQYAANPSPALHKRRLELQTEFDLISTNEAEHLLLRSRCIYYEHGDKASRLLAHQSRRQAASHIIPQIKSSSGPMLCGSREINDAFKNFYSLLYNSECPTDTTDMTLFLENLEMPTLDPGAIEELDSPLSIEEIMISIKSMQNNKAPGPDGFSVEFFKKIQNKLAPLLLSVYNESLKRGSLPQTLTQASITVLLKSNKDPTKCSSYRPVSLLNVDAKILAKELARRLEKFLPKLISKEQTGFIKGRQLFFNVKTLFNIIYSKKSTIFPEVVISLDADKAFDQVEWPYLFATLKHFGFGNIFTSWIRLLYTDPHANVRTNNTSSEYFKLMRGTRQGCPLSPLLFSLVIELLSVALRSFPFYQGITGVDKEFKLSLFADDLLLYVLDPVRNIPFIQTTLQRFGSFSGYKINLLKSICYPINDLALQLQQTLIKTNSIGFRYLGTNITRSMSSLFSANFLPLMTQLKTDLEKWNSLPLSLIGWINTIKMNVLPKLLFLFQCIPLYIPKKIFRSIENIISTFLWNKKAPRIKKSLLQRCKFNGGLSMLNFQLYYWSAHIQKIIYRIRSPDLSRKFELPASHQFHFFQVRHCAVSIFPSFPLMPSQQPWENLLELNSGQRSLISRIYYHLLSLEGEPRIRVREMWE